MNLRLRHRILYRLAAMLAVIMPLVVATAASASASSPSNDEISNATAIASLPFRDVVDLSAATWDFSTDTSYCSGQANSVWYSFTPASSGQVAFDPSPSNQIIA